MGTVLKVVMIPKESWHDLEEVVLEEMTVFRVGRGNSSIFKPLVLQIYPPVCVLCRMPPP